MEPILHKFRTAVFGGFHRNDVLNYIELSARESNAKIRELTERLEAVEQEKAEMAAALDSLRNESGDLAEQEAKVRTSLEESSRSLAVVRGELQTTRTQLTVAKRELAGLQSKVAQIEPLAKRYEALKDRIATVELDAHQKAQTTLDKAQTEVDALHDDTARWMGEVQKTYDCLRAQVGDCAVAAVKAEEAFAAMEEEYQNLLRRGLNREESSV